MDLSEGVTTEFLLSQLNGEALKPVIEKFIRRYPEKWEEMVTRFGTKTHTPKDEDLRKIYIFRCQLWAEFFRVPES